MKAQIQMWNKIGVGKAMQMSELRETVPWWGCTSRIPLTRRLRAPETVQ
jgi:hypothetical protein